MKCRFPHLSTETKENALNNQTHNNRTIKVIKEQDNQSSLIDPFLTLRAERFVMENKRFSHVYGIFDLNKAYATPTLK